MTTLHAPCTSQTETQTSRTTLQVGPILYAVQSEVCYSEYHHHSQSPASPFDKEAWEPLPVLQCRLATFRNR